MNWTSETLAKIKESFNKSEGTAPKKVVEVPQTQLAETNVLDTDDCHCVGCQIFLFKLEECTVCKTCTDCCVCNDNWSEETSEEDEEDKEERCLHCESLIDIVYKEYGSDSEYDFKRCKNCGCCEDCCGSDRELSDKEDEFHSSIEHVDTPYSVIEELQKLLTSALRLTEVI